MFMTVTPAYGRDYKTAKQAKSAWVDGFDFIINQYGHQYDGKPVSINDGAKEKIQLRFCKLTKITNV
tara:strand:+ start:339 stop:539 length:201 start_codon:yes stop_codon:yes gene_type:complete